MANKKREYLYLYSSLNIEMYILLYRRIMIERIIDTVLNLICFCFIFVLKYIYVFPV